MTTTTNQNELPLQDSQDELAAFWIAVEKDCFDRLYTYLWRHLRDAVPSVFNAEDYEIFFVGTFPHAFEAITDEHHAAMVGNANDPAQVRAAVEVIFADMCCNLHIHILEALVNARADETDLARPATIH